MQFLQQTLLVILPLYWCLQKANPMGWVNNTHMEHSPQQHHAQPSGCQLMLTSTLLWLTWSGYKKSIVKRFNFFSTDGVVSNFAARLRNLSPSFTWIVSWHKRRRIIKVISALPWTIGINIKLLMKVAGIHTSCSREDYVIHIMLKRPGKTWPDAPVTVL